VRRTALLVAGFLLSAGILLAALGWVSRLALALAASEAEARRHAVFEERVRLSLWRMDSALAAFLAEENARPPGGLDAGWTAPRPGEAARPYVAARFEIDPSGRVRENPASPPARPQPAPALDRDTLLAGLGGDLLAARQEPAAAAGKPRRAAPFSAGNPSPAAPSPAAAAQGTSARGAPAEATRLKAAPPQVAALPPAAPVPQPSAPDASAAPPAKVLASKAAAKAAKAKDDPVAREMANQSLLNQAEFTQRSNQSGPPSDLAPRSNESSTRPASAAAPSSLNSFARGAAHPDGAGSGAVPGASGDLGAAAYSPRGALAAPPPASSLDAAPPPVSSLHAEPAAPRRASGDGRAARERVLSALSPAWVGDDLVIARRVARGGGELLQGLRLDGPGVRAWLAAQVRDLLPRAALLPLRAGESADPGRRLALLPLRLDPGPLPPLPAAAGATSIRLGLAVASTAVLLAIAAAALLLASSLRLARRRADFVSAVTHELRTPLTTFRLYTEMLAGGMVPEAERPAYLGTLRDEAGRLGHLVENVLAFARLERGRRRLAVEDLELGGLVGETAARLAPRAERDGLALAIELPPEAAAARVRVDRLAVERILGNLVDNACKYGRGAGIATLHLGVRLRDRRAVLTLRDHGPGLARGRRRLFLPFHRSAAAAAGSAPGIGLGLALSRRLARGFGGDLRLADPAGGGAAFELLLPLAP
jgi:signal transduction histidine kinase